MARDIIVRVTDIKLSTMLIDADNATVTVTYKVLLADGSVYRHGEKTYPFSVLTPYRANLIAMRDACVTDLRRDFVD